MFTETSPATGGINIIMQSRISGHSSARGLKESEGVKQRCDLMFVHRHSCLSFLLSRVSRVQGCVLERESESVIGRGPQQYLLHVGVGKIIMANWGINCTSLFAVR